MKFPYWVRVLIALDALANVILGGHLGETISARSGRAGVDGKRWGLRMCRFLSWFQKRHCLRAMEIDRDLAATVVELETKALEEVTG